jgi:hypothetical protein
MHFLSVTTTFFFLICLQLILTSPALAANCPADQQFDDGLLTCTKTATNNFTITEDDIEASPHTSPLKIAFAKCMCSTSSWNTFQNVKTTCMYTAAQTADDMKEFTEYCEIAGLAFNQVTGPGEVVGIKSGLRNTGSANMVLSMKAVSVGLVLTVFFISL